MDFTHLNLRKFTSQEFTGAFSKVRWKANGKVCKVIGNVVEAKLPSASLGALVSIEVKDRCNPVLSELVGFRDDMSLLIPYESVHGIMPGSNVVSLSNSNRIFVGNHLLGQIVDPFMSPLYSSHQKSDIGKEFVTIDSPAINPMERARITKQLPLGVRAIDGLFSFGEGQRVGIMAGSGVGKSVLLGMIAQGSEADVNVIALVGERGREIREFIERDLGSEGLKKSVVVVATSDQSPLLRIKAAKAAVSVAEYFSTKGKKVLLMMDSLSRVAHAQREVGLSVGEPPTSRGYPPSVFSLLPKILERCGPREKQRGSVSGLFTVLVDGDDFSDPIPDSVRAILDGHLNLSRTLANRGHFPSIDIPSSISRVMTDICSKEHCNLSQRIKSLMSTYIENIDFVQMGTYQSGLNPTLDQAIHLMPKIEQFLRQEKENVASIHETVSQMIKIFVSEEAN